MICFLEAEQFSEKNKFAARQTCIFSLKKKKKEEKKGGGGGGENRNRNEKNKRGGVWMAEWGSRAELELLQVERGFQIFISAQAVLVGKVGD